MEITCSASHSPKPLLLEPPAQPPKSRTLLESLSKRRVKLEMLWKLQNGIFRQTQSTGVLPISRKHRITRPHSPMLQHAVVCRGFLCPVQEQHAGWWHIQTKGEAHCRLTSIVVLYA